MFGLQVNLKYKGVKYISAKSILIPFEGKVKCRIKEGETFSKGDVLFSTEKRKIISSYSLIKELDLKTKNFEDFICRIEGEYIMEGEVIAERVVSGGLLLKRVVAEKEGIIDFSRLESGYVDILAELDFEDFVAKFSGKVLDVRIGEGLMIASDVCRIPFASIRKSEIEKTLNGLGSICGQFEMIGEAQGMPSKRTLQKSYDNKIVFAGRFLYPDVVEELYSRGAKFVLVGSMNYKDFIGLNVPIGVILGFGNIYFDEILSSVFREFQNLEVCIDSSSSSLEFILGLNTQFASLFKSSHYQDISVGALVKSFDLDSFGMVGEVISLDGKDGLTSVKMQNNSTPVIDGKNLAIYSEDFSTMLTGITQPV
jgi:hypothetical protein